MTSPVDVCNVALGEIGQRVRINSFTDNTPAANAASLFYTSKVQALIRAANWGFTRATITLTQWKAVLINGVPSANPPPQPFQFSYLYPSDCLKLRFVLPTLPSATQTIPPLTTNAAPLFCYGSAPTAIPFVEATDVDPNNNPIRVVLSNLQQAQAIYTRDMSQFPDLWDPLFHSAVTATLAAYFINALSRDKAQMQEQIGMAKNVLDAARVMNANEGINTIDHKPDWMRIRRTTGIPWMWQSLSGPNGAFPGGAGWDSMGFPNGEFY